MIDAGVFRSAGMVLIGIGFLVLLIAERIRPLRRPRHPGPGRYLANAVMTALALTAGALIVRPVGDSLSAVASARSFGLINAFALPGWIRFTAGFLLMDLSFYYWHRLNHEVPFLWRFHSVHHIDPDLDVTTSMRFHFGEVGVSAVFRAVQVTAVGIAPLTYVTYELFFTLATLFHHSNLELPLKLERRINKILVTPRMHGIHHSVVRSELNSNYSVIFRWWDALHRSLVLNVPQSAVTIGVGRYQNPEDNGIWRLVTLPFGHFVREKAPRPPRFGKSDIKTMVE